MDRLEKILVAFSNLVAQNPIIKEIDINPLFVSSENIVALDARIILHESKKDIVDLVIRPYPHEYVKKEKILKNKKDVLFRPIKPEDEKKVVSFCKNLSEDTLISRYGKSFNINNYFTHDKLIKICFCDYSKEITFVMEKDEKIIAMSRLIKIFSSKEEATISILIQDCYQKSGLGTKIIEFLIGVAKKEKIKILYVAMFEENVAMKALCEKFNFKIHKDEIDGIIKAELKI